MNDIALRRRILATKRFPILPNQIKRLLQAFADENLSYRQLTLILSDHPTIAARLLALANSAWAAPSQPVNSLERACIHLGFTVVRSVSIGLALISPFNLASCPGFDLHRFWVSGKLAADTAQQLASFMPREPEPGFLQTVHTDGLLHNLGLLCLADLLPRETHQALSKVNTMPELTVREALQRTVETDYCEIGGAFAEIWGLPKNLITVMKKHRDKEYRGNYWRECLLTGCAAEMVGGVFREISVMPDVACLEELAITPNDSLRVFENLRASFPITSELARNLFCA